MQKDKIKCFYFLFLWLMKNTLQIQEYISGVFVENAFLFLVVSKTDFSSDSPPCLVK